MDEDTFDDATDDGTYAEVTEDGENVMLTVGRRGSSETLALSAEDAFRMARVLNAYAAGL